MPFDRCLYKGGHETGLAQRDTFLTRRQQAADGLGAAAPGCQDCLLETLIVSSVVLLWLTLHAPHRLAGRREVLRLCPCTFIFDLRRKAFPRLTHPPPLIFHHPTLDKRNTPKPGLDELRVEPLHPETRGCRKRQGQCHHIDRQWLKSTGLLVSQDSRLLEGQGLWLLHGTGVPSAFVA